MGRRVLEGVMVMLSLGTSAAHAQQGDALEREVEGYCSHVQGVAASRSALLYWPKAELSGGTTRGVEVGPSDEASADGTTRLRVLAGLEYDFVDLLKGSAVDGHAELSCAAYRAEQELRAALAEAPELESRAALSARLQVLDEALPRALRFVRELEAEVAAGQATMVDLTTVERELDALQVERMRTRVALESLRETAPRTAQPRPEQLLERYLDAESEVERYESRLRELEAFSVAVRGGYDHVVGQKVDPPIYAMLRLSYAFGGLAQPSADSQAASGRKAWLHARAERLGSEIERSKLRIAALLGAERERLQAVEQRLSVLETRHEALDAVAEGRARDYARALWLELVRARAERAYLARHIDDLAALSTGAPHAR